MAQTSASAATGSNPVLIVVYWAIVSVPLGWGIYKTVQKSVPLFTGAVATPPAAPPAPAVTPAPLLSATPGVTPMPSATAVPYGTTQPSGAVAPIVTPAQPIN